MLAGAWLCGSAAREGRDLVADPPRDWDLFFEPQDWAAGGAILAALKGHHGSYLTRFGGHHITFDSGAIADVWVATVGETAKRLPPGIGSRMIHLNSGVVVSTVR